ncbi:TonB-dependent receptor [Saccharicrinis fermentans]|uniref:Colicin I receptor n=1 Tax=Saccharicrinis fermentans DSM 9555 = JCM 21142 TaxID=869213 RepID=W7YMV7_9BACT|nr:TonB-dependent receptor [Saccharicrinis fermentans]GAF03734.1 colicin I receptor precursor [Saccharicrinis fermentans DSM 9555 = JCM 21142]
MKKQIVVLLGLLCVLKGYGQHTDANIFGDVKSNGEHLPYVSVYVKGSNKGTATDLSGHYMLIDLKPGRHVVVANSVGYKPVEKEVVVNEAQSVEVNFVLEEQIMAIDDVVITGTKTFKRKTDSPVIVNVMEGKMLELVQASTLSEGLVFQPGIRMETDCQTCNYTQLRMNGLGGGYSQILINSRPVFSPLTGLYGLEQIPANMIERIEVVRGGASALYGAGAIGGTVNVITRLPDRDGYAVNANVASVNGKSNDFMVNANVSAVSDRRNSGLTLFASHRKRESYDHNGDGYSEMAQLKNNSFGVNTYLLPAPNHKIELNFSSMYEYRYGGNKEEEPAFLADQSEERVHHVLMGGLDYSVSFNENLSSFGAFLAMQRTDRDHYTGILPDMEEVNSEGENLYEKHLVAPPYGVTDNQTYVGGVQLNHMLLNFVSGRNNLTMGMEYNYDMVDDEISAYQYVVDQKTRNFGAFLQSDWAINRKLTLLAGIRSDKHNMVDNVIVSPRFSLLYKYSNWQFRTSWSTGFRAPQAFDADLHIAFAGGGIQKVQLASDLKEEHSESWSASVNYDYPNEHFIFGFTAEGFYTELKDAFVLEEIGDGASVNSILEKRNGGGSVVKGATIEVRGNYNRRVQLEAGLTVQNSRYDRAIMWSEELPGSKKYLRTPEEYGYFTIAYTAVSGFKVALSGVYTGEMLVPHFGLAEDSGTPEKDVLKNSSSFWDNNVKLSYLFSWLEKGIGLEVSGGVQNVLNAYQDDFDTGKYRDSGYIYGPSRPRTVFLGLKLLSL